MKKPKPVNSFIFSLLIMLGLFSSLLAAGQQAADILSDTATKEIEIISISEISIKSGEVMLQILNLNETLIPDEEIQKIELANGLLSTLLDSLYTLDKASNLKTRSIRYLNNKLVRWRKHAIRLDNEISMLASIIQSLDETNYELGHKIHVWMNTRTVLEEGEAETTTIERIDNLVFKLDSVKELVREKSDMALTILNNTTSQRVVLEDFINDIDRTIFNKNDEIFVQNQPSLFASEFSVRDRWQLKGALSAFYKMEIVTLWSYLDRSLSRIIFQLILMVVLIIAFVIVKQWMKQAKISEDSFYQQALKKISSQSISAAIIIGLLASALVFPNRTEAFKDILRLLATIPLIIIGMTVLARKFHIYMYLFFFAFLLQTVYIVFPPNHLLYSAALILVALTEIFVLGKLIRYFRRNPLSRKFLNSLLILVIFIHLCFALAGLFGVLAGATILAELSLNIPIANVFFGLLIILTAIIANGLIEVGIESPSFQKLNIFRKYGNLLEWRAIRIINLVAIILWIYTMLKIINIERPVVDGLVAFFTDPITVGSATFSLWHIVLFFLIIWLSIVVSKMIRVLLEEDVLDKFSLGKGVPHTIAVMVRYSLITIGVLLAIAAVGFPLDRLSIMFGAFGIGIGFGLQSIFNNIVSGFVLLFERPIQIGDTIEVGTLMGKVKSMGIRSSNVRTFEGAEVIVPNGQLISNEVVNWTLSDQKRRIEIIAGVAYGSDPHLVRTVLLQALEKNPEIVKDPSPNVFFNELGESSLNFRLLFWVANFKDWMRVRNDVMFAIHDALKEAGIEIPFPQRDLHLRSVDAGVEIINKSKK